MLARLRRIQVFSLLLGLLGVACTGGTETGNPPFTGALSYTGRSSAPDDYAVRSGGRIASVQSAWLDLSAVSVSSLGGCDGGAQGAFTVPALGLGDHAAGQHNVTAFQAQPGTFCSVELGFVRAPTAVTGAPDDVASHSLLLLGVLADGTPFSIASAAETVVELKSEAGGFSLDSAQSSAVVVFDFAAWLSGLDLASATRENGEARIDDGSNQALLRRFEAQLATGISVYRDEHGDGRFVDGAELLARAR